MTGWKRDKEPPHVYPTSNAIVTMLGWLFEKEELYKQLQRNYERAKEKGCVGCEFLHLGFRVGHNHCDRLRGQGNYTYQKDRGCFYYTPATTLLCVPHECPRLRKLAKTLETMRDEIREVQR